MALPCKIFVGTVKPPTSAEELCTSTVHYTPLAQTPATSISRDAEPETLYGNLESWTQNPELRLMI